jgi:hypothetical protein
MLRVISKCQQMSVHGSRLFHRFDFNFHEDYGELHRALLQTMMAHETLEKKIFDQIFKEISLKCEFASLIGWICSKKYFAIVSKLRLGKTSIKRT